MSKKCARCDKTVYPTEELKCLDKTWHKICFKCKECNMTLNMRNYKGFNKEPYCEAHIPKAKATTMAETPELRRIAANTKNQSNISYHADFEASKGKFTQVADDPEMMRIKQNTQIISNVAYHGDLARKAEMEQRRQLNENGYSESAPPSNYTRETIPAAPVVKMQQPTMVDQRVDHKNANMVPPSYQPPPQVVSHHQQHSSVGKISDYEPNAASVVSPYSAGRQDRQTLIYSSDRGGSINNPPQSNIGSVHDMDPVNHNYGSLGSRNEPYGNAPPSTGRVYRAMYDYEAQDVDEVSFHDGDLIVNVSSIDGGWMTGQVQRTGKMGMLPANYVKLATI